MSEDVAKAKSLIRDAISIPKELRTRFFKTATGEYANHDRFLGVRVPDLRRIAKSFNHLDFDEISVLLSSKYNEERFFALVLLISKYKNEKDDVYNFYLNNIHSVNNWNLVDLSAHLIVGDYLKYKKDKSILIKLSKSKDLWERRISIVSTLSFIKAGDFEYTFLIAKSLLVGEHDLINKAVGWMLREISKIDAACFKEFMFENQEKMSKTTYAYATERVKL